LTTWRCILSAENAKTHFFRLFLAILPTGYIVMVHIGPHIVKEMANIMSEDMAYMSDIDNTYFLLGTC